MHLVRGNYGQPVAAGGRGGVPPLASSAIQGAGSAAMPAGESLSARRGSASARNQAMHMTDDVEDIVEKVRRDVRVIYDQKHDATAEDRPSDSNAARQRQDTPGVTRSLSRSLSEATWDRPRTCEREEEIPRAQPKAMVRGRYVFSSGAESQVLSGQTHLGIPRGRASETSEPCSLQFSPRPPVRQWDASRGSNRQSDPQGAAAAASSLAEVVESENDDYPEL
eukprot:TRINITY_DN69177_c0_g1_i1.p1 TRINITY_DN69177_c0_g1~~TRINITY_DN69177_c0_g1_i1.p1  ORF type:complete len:223 (-),score=27.94 TRINITY_DN69177_c0_g1_i1:508-1176(-)